MIKRIIAAALTTAAIVVAPVELLPTASADCYINSNGVCVQDPMRPDPNQPDSAPPGATAKCKDGSWSFSQHRSGTCSSHGGVLYYV
jgi:hypothetical protein